MNEFALTQRLKGIQWLLAFGNGEFENGLNCLFILFRFAFPLSQILRHLLSTQSQVQHSSVLDHHHADLECELDHLVPMAHLLRCGSTEPGGLSHRESRTEYTGKFPVFKRCLSFFFFDWLLLVLFSAV